jgi:exodeoxyribonuclease VIII
MRDIMVDLETLDNVPTAVILAIGAVEFDWRAGTLGRQFYAVIGVNSCKRAGLTISGDTMAWWSRQSYEAREVLRQAQDFGAADLGVVLDSFAKYVAECCPKKSVSMWGNGASFDNAILSTAYRAVGQERPWEFWNESCHRMLKRMLPGLEPKREGTHHNALDDAVHQAKHAIAMMQHFETLKQLYASANAEQE